MRIKTLTKNDLPDLSANVKEHITEGFWSLVEVNDLNGVPKLFIKTEEEIIELTKKGSVRHIFSINEFKMCINAKVNFAS